MIEDFDRLSEKDQIEDQVAKSKLIELLKTKKAILMVGSGSSKIVGYPLWYELIDQLHS